jgi:hypothetical protein
VKEQRESERRVVQVLSEDLTVGVVPLTAEEEVLRCLLCTATAVWAVYLVNAMKVGFVVAVSNLELVKAHWNDELLSGFPCKLCRVCVSVISLGRNVTTTPVLGPFPSKFRSESSETTSQTFYLQSWSSPGLGCGVQPC